jgi:hypothetical protein
MRREEALLPGRHIIAPTLYAAAAASGVQTNATPQKNTPQKIKIKYKDEEESPRPRARN